VPDVPVGHLLGEDTTVYYGNSRQDAASIGFDDDFIYGQIPLAPDKRTVAMKPLLEGEAKGAFKAWATKTTRSPISLGRLPKPSFPPDFLHAFRQPPARPKRTPPPLRR